MPLPQWMRNALGNLIIKHVLLKRGRNGRSWIDQYRQDMIDYARYEHVNEARNQGLSWNNAYSVVYTLLQGSLAAGSESAISGSYKRVCATLKKTPLRYKKLQTVGDVTAYIEAKAGKK